MAGGQFLLGAGQEGRGPQGQVQVVGPPKALDRHAPLAGPPQQPAVGQQQPGGVHRALRVSGLLAAGVDLPGLGGVALLLGQPPLQPGHGRLQVTGLAGAHSTLSPGTPARHRRARDVLPIPGSPSMATSHGCPACTRATTSATRASSAARPTNTSSGSCRSCTRPHLVPTREAGHPDE